MKRKRRINHAELLRRALTPCVGPDRKRHKFGNFKVPAMAHVKDWGWSFSGDTQGNEDKRRSKNA